MRILFAAFLIIAVTLFSQPASAGTSPYRAGAGLEYDVVTGDGDNGYGAYAYYNLDLASPLGLMIDLSYVTGDYDVPDQPHQAYPEANYPDSDSYSMIGLGVALVFRGEFGDWSPYAGAGAANYFNDFGAANYDDRLGMFLLGGASVAVSDRVTADFSLRSRTLRPDSEDKEIGGINMDAYMCRAGIVFQF